MSYSSCSSPLAAVVSRRRCCGVFLKQATNQQQQQQPLCRHQQHLRLYYHTVSSFSSTSSRCPGGVMAQQQRHCPNNTAAIIIIQAQRQLATTTTTTTCSSLLLLMLSPRGSTLYRSHARRMLTSSTTPSAAAAAAAAADSTAAAAAAAAATKKQKQKQKKDTNEANGTPKMGYMAQKAAAKDRRRDLYHAAQERKERLKIRRRHGRQSDDDGQQRQQHVGERRRAFRSFFLNKKINEEYMNRKARQAGMDWKIRVAVILERINVVLPDLEQFEDEYYELKAHLDQYGERLPADITGVDHETMAPPAITNDELLALLPDGYTPAPRETAADASGDVRTLDRQLKECVHLMVLDEMDDHGYDGGDEGGATPATEDATMMWQLPTVDIKADVDETLLDAAKRALTEKIGTDVEYWCPSYCPCAVDLVPYNPAASSTSQQQQHEGYYGTKTFFMKLQYDEGAISGTADALAVNDYAWLTRSEIVERIRQGQEPQRDHVNKHNNNLATFYHYLLR